MESREDEEEKRNNIVENNTNNNNKKKKKKKKRKRKLKLFVFAMSMHVLSKKPLLETTGFFLLTWVCRRECKFL